MSLDVGRLLDRSGFGAPTRRRRALLAVAACVGAIVAAGLPSSAYVIGEEAIFANVPFPFEAGSRSLPPGIYRLGHRVGPFASVMLSSRDGKVRVPLLALERPDRTHSPDAPAAGLVFDKIGDRHVLAEVWLTGLSGFRLRSTKPPPVQVTVGAIEQP
jgi:hypothetical protein